MDGAERIQILVLDIRLTFLKRKTLQAVKTFVRNLRSLSRSLKDIMQTIRKLPTVKIGNFKPLLH